jgi:SOS response regulatory protein OraA/RecX
MTCANNPRTERRTTMALPTLTPEQRAEALKKAAAARTARKELRDAIAAGKETIPNVLSRAKSDQIVGKTKVADLLKSLPGYGPAKVNALLQQTGIDASRRAAGLGDRQRQALLDALK